MTANLDEYDLAHEAAEHLRAISTIRPRVVTVLGSGLRDFASRVSAPVHVRYAEIPSWPSPTVEGHAGELVLGRVDDVPVAVLSGRVHLYEGFAPATDMLPLRTLRLLGAQTLVTTNAAGGLNPAFEAGALMLMSDHIGFPSLSGHSPLSGPNDQRFGPRFPAMAAAYDSLLRDLTRTAAGELGIPLREGVYVMVGGPSYETPAELRMLRLLGGDAVGMSTIPEVLVARHMGMRVMGISVITNAAPDAPRGAGDGEPDVLDHADVLRAAEVASARLSALLERVIARM